DPPSSGRRASLAPRARDRLRPGRHAAGRSRPAARTRAPCRGSRRERRAVALGDRRHRRLVETAADSPPRLRACRRGGATHDGGDVTATPLPGARGFRRLARRTALVRGALVVALLALVVAAAATARHPGVRQPVALPVRSGDLIVL